MMEPTLAVSTLLNILLQEAIPGSRLNEVIPLTLQCRVPCYIHFSWAATTDFIALGHRFSLVSESSDIFL